MRRFYALILLSFFAMELMGQEKFDLTSRQLNPEKLKAEKQLAKFSAADIVPHLASPQEEDTPPFYIPPRFNGNSRANPMEFNVTYNGGPALFPDDLIDAYENGALAILSQLFSSDVPVNVEVFAFTDNPNALAGAIPANAVPFALFPCGECWYPIALAEKMIGFNINEDEPDVFVIVNPNFPWFYDYENPGNIGGRTDFVSVVLHEMLHGLGFAGGATVDTTGLGFLQDQGRPWVYDFFLTEDGQKLIDTYGDPSRGLADALTSENLFFNNDYFGDTSSFQLFAPSEYDQGSSIAHLDDVVYGNIEEGNSLMTPSIAPGVIILDPGEVVDTMMDDMGWFSTSIFPENLPPDDTTFSADAEVPVTVSIRTDEELDLSTLLLIFALSTEEFGTLYQVPFTADPGDTTYTAILPAPREEMTIASFYAVETTAGKIVIAPGLTLDGFRIPVFYSYGSATSLRPAVSRDADLNVFPNPVKDQPLQYELNLNGQARALSLQVVDPLGRMLTHQRLDQSATFFRDQIDLQSNAPGLYTLRILMDDGSIARTRFLVAE